MNKNIIIKHRLKKFLKIFSIILLLAFISLIAYSFVRSEPSGITFSNVSSSSITVSWSSKSLTPGFAYVVEKKGIIPFSIFTIGKDLFYDTRDIGKKELQDSQKTMENTFSNNSTPISFDNIVSSMDVIKPGRYYTHHVEIKNLNPETEYEVMIGDGIIFRKAISLNDNSIVKTTKIPEQIFTPVPRYGTIKDAQGMNTPVDELMPLSDGVVYLNYLDEATKERSNVFSSPINSEGNWYIDSSSAVDKEGEPFISKYVDSLPTNILVELRIDAGPKGLWKKVVPVEVTSPADTIVINDPELVNGEGLNILQKVGVSNFINDNFVKGVNANSCVFVGYCACGENVGGTWKDCSTCDQATWNARKCDKNQQSLSSAIQEIATDPQNRNCGGGGSPNSTALVNGVCKSCTDGRWVNTDASGCSNITQNGAIDQSGGVQQDTLIDDDNNDQPQLEVERRVIVVIAGQKENLACNQPQDQVARGCECYYPVRVGIGRRENINYGQSCTAVSLPAVINEEVTNEVVQQCHESTAANATITLPGSNTIAICVNGRIVETVANSADSAWSGSVNFSNTVLSLAQAGPIGILNSVTTRALEIQEQVQDVVLSVLAPTIKYRANCDRLICRCPDGSIINWAGVCREVSSCSGTDVDGKVCDYAGHTCQDGRCNGPKVKSGLLNSPEFVSKAYAIETPSYTEFVLDSQTGILTGIEAGVYSFEHQGERYYFQVTDELLERNNGKVFLFVDSNGNYKFDKDDKPLSEYGSVVKISTAKQKYDYSLKTGFNFVSFPFLITNEEARMASGLIKTLNNTYQDAVFSISKYDGTWKIFGVNGQSYSGTDFQIIPGQGYILKAMRNVDISLVGKPIVFEKQGDYAPITLYPGWNLIGTYGTNVKKYTAKSLIQGINSYEPIDFTADNVSRWESDVQRYDGLQITNQNGIDIEYGFDFPINNLQSYFVRILQGRGNWQPELQ